MQLYIYRNNEQTGPFDEESVLSRLRSGALSPDDLGIRQGETKWSSLGDLFAGRIPEPTLFASVPPIPTAAAGQASATAPTAKKSAGGCRLALGWMMLVFGLLMFLGGLSVTLSAPYLYYMPLCPIAERDYATIEDLKKKYDAADEYDKDGLRYELAQAIDSYDSSSRMCADERATRQLFMIGGGAVAAAGFLMAVIGFFVRRVRRA
jgi:hypothetical protein